MAQFIGKGILLVGNLISEYPILILVGIVIGIMLMVKCYLRPTENDYHGKNDSKSWQELNEQYQSAYFTIDENTALGKYPLFYLKDGYGYFKDQVIKLDDVVEVDLDLKARNTVIGSFSTEFVFDILIDIKTNEQTFCFKAMNKDDLIEVIRYFKEMNITINDPRNIEESYYKYPNYLNRLKYYRRSFKVLTKYENSRLM